MLPQLDKEGSIDDLLSEIADRDILFQNTIKKAGGK